MSKLARWQIDYRIKVSHLGLKEVMNEALQMAFLSGFHVSNQEEAIPYAWKATISKKALVRLLENEEVL